MLEPRLGFSQLSPRQIFLGAYNRTYLFVDNALHILACRCINVLMFDTHTSALACFILVDNVARTCQLVLFSHREFQNLFILFSGGIMCLFVCGKGVT